MKIDKYEARVERGGNVAWYAIAGKKEVRMPSAFADMYTDDYLEIEETHYDMPEIFGLSSATVWTPRRTA